MIQPMYGVIYPSDYNKLEDFCKERECTVADVLEYLIDDADFSDIGDMGKRWPRAERNED